MSGFTFIVRFCWICCLLTCLLGKAGCRSASLPGDLPPVGTHVVETEVGFQLYREGEPFYIKGACVLDLKEFTALKEAGANTIRTYPGIDLDSVFYVADSLGLAVIPGLDVFPMRHGIDYSDSAEVQRIKARVREQVLRYKDEPALLMWGLGNEVTLLHPEAEETIFGVIDELSQMVHELDSLHPTTYMTDGPTMGFLKVWHHCKDLDVISINAFWDINEQVQIQEYGGWFFDKPVLVSEWTPIGYWQTEQTSWGAPLEPNAEEKAYSYFHYYNQFLSGKVENFLGGCMFLWGQKQEQTHTWFSSFSEQGEATTIVDQMHYLWSGSYPDNRAPLAQAIQVDTFKIKNEIFLEQGRTYQAVGYAKDDNGDSLTYDWEITPEYERHGITGGDREERPHAMPHLFEEARGDTLLFQAPDTTGAYRLYFYARDGRGKVGITNVPFYVLPPAGLQLRTEK